jgi:hypothetical protein
MFNRHGTLLVRILVAALAVTLSIAPDAAAAACRWTVVPSPASPDVADSGFNSISFSSPSEAWVTGSTEHWDGRAWKVVPTPNVGPGGLVGVSDLSPSDAWIAGYFIPPNRIHNHTLTEHWDGRAWTVVPSPNASKEDNQIFGISATSASDVWVAGVYTLSGYNKTLIEHWNGMTWTIVPSPSPSHHANRLWGVSASSPSDVWAVGNVLTGSIDHTLTEHWDGHTWTVVPSPNVSNGYPSILLAVSAISPSDAWAVGWGAYRNFAPTLIEHWNGRVWKIVPSPQPPGYRGYQLIGVSAISAKDAWAVGYSITSDNHWIAFSEHWDGHVWTVVPTLDPGTTTVLDSISSISSTNVWAAGGYIGTDGHVHSLIELWKC